MTGLATRYFSKHAHDLRANIASQFKERFESHMQTLIEIDPPEELITQAKDLEIFVRKGLTRKGLDVLCAKGQVEDRHLIRQLIESDFVKSSEPEIAYLAKTGEWSDIPAIVNATNDHGTTTPLQIASKNTDWNTMVATAAFRIGKARFDDLVRLAMPAGVLVEILRVASNIVFEGIGKTTLLELLDNSNEKVRKCASIKSVITFPKNRLASLLAEYVGSEDHRFYNVILWLDLGASMPRSEARAVARRALAE